VANKIGTYLKALAAHDNHIPFYVAIPSSSIDFNMADGNEVVIENRAEQEITYMDGWNEKENIPQCVRILPENTEVVNPGFDITPARLVTGLITERGICNATEEGIQSLFGA
jgi:methylthioribose-1-phosphate isomerase